MESNSDELPCAGKLAFDTKQQAEGSGVVAAWRHGTKMKAYQCKYCNLWHLASQYED